MGGEPRPPEERTLKLAKKKLWLSDSPPRCRPSAIPNLPTLARRSSVRERRRSHRVSQARIQKQGQRTRDPVPVPAPPRKQAASSAQQSAKVKAPKVRQSEDAIDDDDNMDLMCRPLPKKRATRGVVVDSDHDESPEIVPTQPQPSKKKQEAGHERRQGRHQSTSMPRTLTLLTRKILRYSRGLAADEAKRRLADSAKAPNGVPQWSSSNTNDEDYLTFSRPSSQPPAVVTIVFFNQTLSQLRREWESDKHCNFLVSDIVAAMAGLPDKPKIPDGPEKLKTGPSCKCCGAASQAGGAEAKNSIFWAIFW
ncbi:hypothetical protein B0H14DRAFT_3152260 [Mycena olivaceomarginata]|nr:hypothetical protein B0H14DRAFT_3152260 [Mycena olivaceomarginata]